MVDRALIQVAELPCAEDFLFVNKAALYGFANLIAAAIGPNAGVSGFAISPTTIPSLSVIIGTGSIYASATADSTAYGVLGTDSNVIMKQGELNLPVTLAITPPSTSGYSQYYVVEAAYNDVDTGSALAPFYNSLNPAAPSSATINTIRQGQAVVALKAGAAAATGSEAPPAVDPGYVPLYVIHVTNGQSSITSTNWYQHPAAPFFPNLESLTSLFIPIVPATTFYVNASTGSDSNDGLSATSAGAGSGHGPFQTGQGAVNYISKYFCSGTVTVNFAAGTYAGFNVNASQIAAWNIVGAGYATTTISATTTVTNGGRGLVAYGNSIVTVGGFTFTAYAELLVANHSIVNLSTTLPNAFVGVGSNSYGVAAYNGGNLTVYTNQTQYISGTFNNVISAQGSSEINIGYNFGGVSFTPVFSFGTTSCTTVAASGTGASIIFAYDYVTWSGSTPTGVRYSCTQGATIQAVGGGTSFIPGTVAGVAATSTSLTTSLGLQGGSYYS